LTGGRPANFGGISIIALQISTATGLRSLAYASSPSRWASSGSEPPPANGSWKAGSLSGLNSSAARGWSLLASQVSRQLLRISSRACSSTASLVVFSHLTSSSISRKSRWRSASCASSVGNRSGWADGSSTIWAKITARAAASGRRAHHKCSVLGCPCLIDFSRAEAALIASSGRATSISFLGAETSAMNSYPPAVPARRTCSVSWPMIANPPCVSRPSSLRSTCRLLGFSLFHRCEPLESVR
jgi:hypothetical protein